MDLTPIEITPGQLLYEQVANRLESLITQGILKPGDRLPSVRKLQKQLTVSLSTVLEAYRLLEDRGLISARPQSGYYVKPTALHPEPCLREPYTRISEIKTSLAFQLMTDSLDANIVPLGAAVPTMDHFPIAQLNRLMSKVLRDHPITAHTYNTPLGCQTLRSELAKRMLDVGCSIHPDQFVITNGANEAIYLSLQAVTQPGDTVAVESPLSFGMLEAMKVLQLKAFSLPTHPREGICLVDLEEALQTEQVKACLLVSNFSNPLGCCMDDAKKKQLVDLLNRYEIPLIEDDVYGDLYFKGTRPKAIKAFDTENRVLYCSSTSKTLSPGLRVGWCVGGRYHPQIVQNKSIINLTTATAPQLTVAAFLASGGYERHLRHLRRTLQSQMNYILQAIGQYFPTETCVTQPHGGHVLWLELPEGFKALHLYQGALDHGISIAPGPMFSASGQCYANCFRLNTAVPWSDAVEYSIKILGQLAKKQVTLNILEPS